MSKWPALLGAFFGLVVNFCRGFDPIATWREPQTGMEFVRIERGEFTMGSPVSEAGREEQEVSHRVALDHDFFLGRTEVTQRQWTRVMGSNPSDFQDCGGDCPVESVSWFAVVEFITRFERLTGESFRLPTEAEWEYACRAGSTTPFHTGGNLTSDQANYAGHFPYAGFSAGVFRGRPLPVARFPANAWGVFDLHGNVWEWTGDDHCPYEVGAETVTDPVGRCASGLKVIRGGSWYFDANSARCALRFTHAPRDRGFSLGFRLVRPLP